MHFTGQIFALDSAVVTCVTLVKAGLVLGPLHVSVRPSICWSVRNIFWVPSLCNLYLQKFSFLIIQTLYNDCSHIEDVHLIFCEHFMNIFSFLQGDELLC